MDILPQIEPLNGTQEASAPIANTACVTGGLSTFSFVSEPPPVPSLTRDLYPTTSFGMV